MRAGFEERLAEAGAVRRPRLIAARRPVRGAARVFGSFPRYWVVTDRYSVSWPDQELRAVFAHELAHPRW